MYSTSENGYDAISSKWLIDKAVNVLQLLGFDL